MGAKGFDLENMGIDIQIDCQHGQALDMVLDALQEKFPKWKFDRQEHLVLFRKDDPQQRQPHTRYTAKAWINQEDQLKG